MKAPHHLKDFIVHLLTVLVLLLKGYDKIEHHQFVSGGILVALGVSVLVLTFFSDFFSLSHQAAKTVCYFIEFVALSIIAFSFFTEGKQFLPYAFAFSALLYLIVAVVKVRRQSRQ